MCPGENRDNSGSHQARYGNGITSLSRHTIDLHGVTNMCMLILYILKEMSHLLADDKSECL